MFNIIVFGFKKPKFKNTNFWSKGGLQHNGFFLSTCVLQNVKSYRFFWGAFFWQFFGCFSKNTIKIGILAHFSKQKITKKNGIFKCYYLVQVKCYYLVQVGCVLKSVNLDQIITFKILARNFCLQKKRAETPIFIVFFDNRCFIKSKLGPDNNI